MRQLRRFAVFHRNNEINWDNNTQIKYMIYYDHNDECLYVDDIVICQHFGAIYFDSESDANAIIDIFHNELIWYFTEYKDSL